MPRVSAECLLRQLREGMDQLRARMETNEANRHQWVKQWSSLREKLGNLKATDLESITVARSEATSLEVFDRIPLKEMVAADQMQHRHDGGVPDLPCVFDEMPCVDVVWDGEMLSEQNVHSGLLEQLAKGRNYMNDENLCNLQVQEGEFITVEKSQSAAHELLDGMSSKDVIWDEEQLHGLHLQDEEIEVDTMTHQSVNPGWEQGHVQVQSESSYYGGTESDSFNPGVQVAVGVPGNSANPYPHTGVTSSFAFPTTMNNPSMATTSVNVYIPQTQSFGLDNVLPPSLYHQVPTGPIDGSSSCVNFSDSASGFMKRKNAVVASNHHFLHGFAGSSSSAHVPQSPTHGPWNASFPSNCLPNSAVSNPLEYHSSNGWPFLEGSSADVPSSFSSMAARPELLPFLEGSSADVPSSFSSMAARPELLPHGNYVFPACDMSQCNTWISHDANGVAHGVSQWEYSNAVANPPGSTDMPNGNLQDYKAGHSSIHGPLPHFCQNHLHIRMQWDPGISMATAWGQAVFRGGSNVMTQERPKMVKPSCRVTTQPKSQQLYTRQAAKERRVSIRNGETEREKRRSRRLSSSPEILPFLLIPPVILTLPEFISPVSYGPLHAPSHRISLRYKRWSTEAEEGACSISMGIDYRGSLKSQGPVTDGLLVARSHRRGHLASSPLPWPSSELFKIRLQI